MTKKMLIIILTFVLIAAIPIRFFESDTSKTNPIKGAKNFVVFYSVINSENISRIQAYDLAIINVSGVTNRILNRLKASDTLLYSYVSAVSVEKNDILKTSLMGEEDYLYIDGEKVYNAQFDCNYGDILSENYQRILLRIVKERVVDKGLKGVFIDTLDDIEYLTDQDVKKAQFEGYMDFFGILKKEFPELSIIQNRGFSFYAQGSFKYVDGLIYEDLKIGNESAFEHTQDTIDSIVSTAKDTDNVILAISHENRMKNYEFCMEQKWLYYYSSYTNNYLHFEDSIDSVDQTPDSQDK